MLPKILLGDYLTLTRRLTTFPTSVWLRVSVASVANLQGEANRVRLATLSLSQTEIGRVVSLIPFHSVIEQRWQEARVDQEGPERAQAWPVGLHDVAG